MDLVIAFFIFMAVMLVTIITGKSVVGALFVGFICFFIVAILRGNSIKAVGTMAYKGVKTSYVVIKLMVLIGCLTALWRASGTISFFVYYGISIITPSMFIMISFVLTCILSYFLGSSFGVCSTAGVMLMILAHSGGVNEIITAGAIISGSYFGDRTSPVSSSAFLTATITGIGQKKNTNLLIKTGVFPLIISGIFYMIVSIKNPIIINDTSVLDALKESYNISIMAALPAVVLLVLPFFKTSVSNTILCSFIVAFVVAMVSQGQSASTLVRFAIVGYELQNPLLGDIMSGGGIVSMVEVIFVVMLSSSYAGIFEGTNMLGILKKTLEKTTGKLKLFTVQVLFSIVAIMVFCNQTIGTILSVQLLGDIYEKRKASKEELAADIGNSLITICGIIPWSIACAVPLSMLGVGIEAIPWSVFLWLNPICYIFSKRIFFNKGNNIDKSSESI